MDHSLVKIALVILLLPLVGALVAGLLGKKIGRRATHTVTISLVAVSFLLSLYVVWALVFAGQTAVHETLYTWIVSGETRFTVGLLVDRLSAVMLVIVTFISLAVHLYTVGYMADDPGYQRFFSYVSLFTFAMLTLVLADNFLLMFFGWEGVGFVSYLLISFWFTRDAAVAGGMKAFIVNRVGDLGFVLALAAILFCFGSLDFQTVFAGAPLVADISLPLWPGTMVPAMTLICLLLFIGAMGKSAQIPLHVWLPESMEGPTPISALIHAATMVTAGIYMIARCSWLFEYSPAMLSIILILGATTCLLMGILAVFQQDIKRVIAYSTLSQLGYMAVGLGASAYDAAIFHLLTHAFFKALLFLAAGSVIIALHHEQDMRKMGGLATRLPITCLTFFIGALALAALPPFSGFYSKEAIIEAVHLSQTPGAHYAYVCVMIGAFLTPLYIFRALFLTFYGKYRGEHSEKVHESSWVMLIPLIFLAIPSLVIGGLLIGPMLFDSSHLLGSSIFVLPQHNVLGVLAEDYQGAVRLALHAGNTLTFWLVMAGIATAWVFNSGFPQWATLLKQRFSFFYWIIQHKYGFDDFNQFVLVRGARGLGRFFYRVTDLWLIDGLFVNGSGHVIRLLANAGRRLQTGYLYHYAFAMAAGLLILLIWLL